MNNDDIVTRLRNHIAITTRVHYSPKDGYPEPVMVHGPSPICQEAADEIERLREALRHEQEEVAACCIDRRETQRERDEARRDYCWASAAGEEHKALNIARSRGWDCFKENTND